MKRVIFLIFVLLIIIPISIACDFVDIETYVEESNFLVYEGTTTYAGESIIISDFVNENNRSSFLIYNPNDFEVVIVLNYTVEGYCDEFNEYGKRLFAGETEQVIENCYKDDQVWDTYINESEVFYYVSSPDRMYSATLNITKEREVCNKECSIDDDCNSGICNILGYCGDTKIVSCPEGYMNCNNVSCLIPSTKDSGNIYSCEWECNSTVGFEGICKSSNGTTCENDNECLSGTCNPAGYCGNENSFICLNGYLNCNNISCLKPSSKSIGENYSCEWECNSSRGENNVCLESLSTIRTKNFYVLLIMFITILISAFLIVRNIKRYIAEKDKEIKEKNDKWGVEKGELIQKQLRFFKILKIIGYVSYIIYIGKYLVDFSNDKIKSYQKQWEMIYDKLNGCILEVNEYCTNKTEYLSKFPTYLTYNNKDLIFKKIEDYNTHINQIEMLKDKLPEEINSKVQETIKSIKKLEPQIKKYNSKFIIHRKEKYNYLFNRKDLKLDDDQQTAIITDDKHNLIVAGAGSGKTEVLVTRMGYLVKREPDKVEPNKILALAYQTKAALEIKERLKKRYGVDIEVKTFHSLGNKMLKNAEKITNLRMPKLKFGDNNKKEFKKYIGEVFNKITQERDITNEMVNFMRHFGDEEILKNIDAFDKKEEFYEYQRNLTYTTLDGTKVKSEAEREIYNFFFMHKLNGKPIIFEYEQPAEWMTYRDEKNEPPKPDFFFTKYNIYLEHWAIGKNGKVPEWFESNNPTEGYKLGMDKKKKEFDSQNEFILIESSHADYQKGDLIEKVKEKFLKALKEKYPKENFVLELKPYDELVNQVWEECKLFVKKIADNISTFIEIAKTYSIKPEELDKRVKDSNWPLKQRTFAKIANRVYRYYQNDLSQNNEMDFYDMINLAVDLLKNNPDFYKDKYNHILVDEYQDISNQRYLLLKQLMLKNKDCKLFCVGDDWQSIMGFSGSNIKFFVEFEKFFSHCARTDLSNNYRSVSEIVNTGAHIIKHNGNVQLTKVTKAHSKNSGQLTVYSSSHKLDNYKSYKNKVLYLKQVCGHAVDKMEELFKKGYKPNDILCLSRITSNPIFVNLLVDIASKKGITIALNTKSPKKVTLMSVHKSKGLQAKIVFLFNVDQGTYGFPCEINNPKIYEIATNEKNENKEEEERRLFYVAVTRAKHEVLIYNRHDTQSKFITEIKDFVKREII
ncbi:UvrD-helicase domain-containing protein [archaeon]|jgi:DNA helicase IV|nr:UvrD-helicase domain-containing protein [archaeon]MBT3450411.1 UvrD-helicase domain-containing protein [archaeon]MBT6868503.1 UvrD-helicase domain-containing protein [archaeon]MBT7193283.1 UvrD-helicase domain-containing protein [archaeon]MBT7380060.1 UvrD-helicase domain-containing protein [archaeon]